MTRHADIAKLRKIAQQLIQIANKLAESGKKAKRRKPRKTVLALPKQIKGMTDQQKKELLTAPEE